MRISKPPAQRRAELVLAARKLFDKNGVENTRISDIVQEVGVAQGVFYYYFKSKEEMVDTVLEQVQAEMQKQIETILKSADDPFEKKLAAFIELYLQMVDQFTADDVQNLPTLLEDTLQNPNLQKAHELITQQLLLLVKQAQNKGEIDILYPMETVLVVLHGLRAIAATRLPTRKMIYAITEQSLAIESGKLMNYL